MENNLELIKTCCKIQEQLVNIKKEFNKGSLSFQEACSLLAAEAAIIHELQPLSPKWAEASLKFIQNFGSSMQEIATNQASTKEIKQEKRTCGFKVNAVEK